MSGVGELTRVVDDAGTGVVELRDQVQGAGGAAAVDAVALHVVLLEVRIVQQVRRQIRIEGRARDREERIAAVGLDGLRLALLPYHGHLIVAGHEEEAGPLGGERKQELLVEDGLRHERLVEQRPGHRHDLILRDLLVPVGVVLADPTGRTLDRPNA